MLFATLTLEREPMQWAEVPQALINWLQSAGAIAALGLFLVFVSRASFSFQRLFASGGTRVSSGLVRLGTICTVASWAGFVLVGALYASSLIGLRWSQPRLPGANPEGFTVGDYLFGAAGGLALAVVIFPVLRACLVDMRFGRIWAVARLSLKEAIRNGSVAVFGVIAIIFLFADWFIPYSKPEDQVRNYVWVLYWTITVLFLLSAGVLGSFSLPNDIKSQTIHTVVTKPITKFEVVLGRFLGYGLLLTVSLFLVGTLSLGYIVRGVTAEAEEESFRARIAEYGKLGFINSKGDSVGREWDYRRYIGGDQPAGPGKKQYAVWYFSDLSTVEPRKDPVGREYVRLEFSFDIFRLTKGEENKGVLCTFKFADGKTSYEAVEKQLVERRREFDKRRSDAVKAKDGAVDLIELNPKIEADLLKDFPVFEQAAVEVKDYHTQSIDVPFALIEHLRGLDASQALDAQGRKPAAMQVLVSIDPDRASAAQMLGVAPHDLYILAAEKGFYGNFLKGLVGLWLGTLLVLGVAVCCSTYLSGVISLLCIMFLFIAGFFTPSIAQMANNQSLGGGPAEAFTRIITKTNMIVPLDDVPTTAVIQGVDEGFRWLLRRVLTLIPDASRYDLHPYVANGFDISVSRILFTDNFLPLVGYLVPWFILAFYLINYREIANPM
jgi:ABC-type transport system involved in multi-copper enzyme maturation permease subunit